jgi:hypothetical protein
MVSSDMIRSTRAPCPFCKTPLTGKIIRRKNLKLDNGDPDYVEYTLCPKCKKHIFTENYGMVVNLERTKK